MRGFFIFITWVLSLSYFKTYARFTFKEKAIYQDIIHGKTLKANRAIIDCKLLDDNATVLWLEDYNEFIKLYLLESETDFSNYIKHNEQRIHAIEKQEVANEWKGYYLAELHLHQAFARFIFAEYTSGFWSLRRSYLILNDYQKKYSSFRFYEKNKALIQALTGILPDKYHWILNLLGVEPNFEKGTEALKKFALNNEFFFQDECKLIYGILLFHAGNDKQEAISFFQQQQFPQVDNLLAQILYSNLLLHHHQNIEAGKWLQSFKTNNDYLKVPYVDYLRGIFYLQQLKADEAIPCFIQYVKQTKTKNYIKSSYQKLAWGYLLKNNIEGYKKQCQNIVNMGANQREADKQAQKEAIDGLIPNKPLLEARLLFDAGFYAQALQIMNDIDIVQLNTAKDKTEYYYRKARITDKMKQTQQAIALYETTIKQGEKLPFYYAASAALYVGYLYKQQNNKEQARFYFQKCISLKNHEYENSLSQKAKLALNQL